MNQYWEEFFSNWRKAGRGKAAAVHSLRITSRRLVVSLEILAELSDERTIPQLRRRLKTVIRRLGQLRDIQVQKKLTGAVIAETGIKGFRRHLDRKEGDEAKRTEDILDREERKTIERKSKQLESAFELLKLSDAAIRRAVQRIIRKRSVQVGQASKELDVSDMDSVHRMRIGLKKLRYTLESSSVVFGMPEAARLAEIKVEQRRLGHLRDLDMLRKSVLRWSRKHGTGGTRQEIRSIELKLRNSIGSQLKEGVDE